MNREWPAKVPDPHRSLFVFLLAFLLRNQFRCRRKNNSWFVMGTAVPPQAVVFSSVACIDNTRQTWIVHSDVKQSARQLIAPMSSHNNGESRCTNIIVCGLRRSRVQWSKRLYKVCRSIVLYYRNMGTRKLPKAMASSCALLRCLRVSNEISKISSATSISH